MTWEEYKLEALKTWNKDEFTEQQAFEYIIMKLIEEFGELIGSLAKEKYHNWRLGELKIIVDFAKDDPALGPDAKKSQKPKKQIITRSPNNSHVRQSVYEQRHFGSRVGAKFAKRNRKK